MRNAGVGAGTMGDYLPFYDSSETRLVPLELALDRFFSILNIRYALGRRPNKAPKIHWH